MSITNTLAKLGVAAPPALAKIADIERALRAAAVVDDGSALFAQSIVGNSWNAEAAVKMLRHVVDTRNRNATALALVREHTPVFERATALATRLAGDDVITALRPTFDREVAKLAAAVSITGPAPAGRMSTAGPGAQRAWAEFQEAVGVLGDISMVRNELADVGYGNRNHRLAAFLDTSTIATRADAVKAQAVENGEGNAFARWLTAGLTLRLNLAAEADACAARLVSFPDTTEPVSPAVAADNRRTAAMVALFEKQQAAR